MGVRGSPEEEGDGDADVVGRVEVDVARHYSAEAGLRCIQDLGLYTILPSGLTRVGGRSKDD